MLLNYYSFLYWYVLKDNLKLQNLFLLVSSFYFYSCWDLRFLLLLSFSIGIDFYFGKLISTGNTELKRKIWLRVIIITKLGILGVFKYYDFFTQSAVDLFSKIGIPVQFETMNLILPVGISFYTFHGLSYVIDIYYKRIEPEGSLINYSVFVSFFPLLVSGPIERATSLLPQISKRRTFDYSFAVNGLKQILWGFFKKVVIADNCAEYVSTIFRNQEEYTSSTLILGVILFGIQIYCDFSGYTDIAIGSAKLFGIELLRNFNFPYFSKSITEFWRKWHISLTSWLTDYLYTPMIIRWRNWGLIGIHLSVFLTFLISGLWHGAGWNFIVWGLLHGLAISFELFTKKIRKKGFQKLPLWLGTFIGSFFTLVFVGFTYIFFRAENLTIATQYVGNIFSKTVFSIPYFPGIGASRSTLLLIIIFFIIEYQGKENTFAIEKLGLSWKWQFRWLFYSLIVFFIGFFIHLGSTPFIYFQF
jgi:alginate O-acetyltransferase complex protein AlgI